MGEKMGYEFCLKMPDFHVTFRDLLHAVNLRHGTDGFTSPPKEGVLRNFSPRKIQRLRLGSNPRNWVTKTTEAAYISVTSAIEKGVSSSHQKEIHVGMLMNP